MSDIEELPGLGHNFPPDEPETPEQRLAKIDPERLVVVETAEIPTLLDLHYPDLKARAAEMLAACQKWQADHKTPSGGIIDVKDDAENAALADFMRQADDFMKEADEARRRVKLQVHNAVLAIDGYFRGGQMEPIADIRGVTRIVSGKKYPPGIGTMQFAMSSYLDAKAARERQEREAAARAAEIDARRRADEARRLADEERHRIALLRDEGIAPETAQEIAQAETDRASAEADTARASSALIGSYAGASTSALVRQQTATGTTVSVRETWDVDEETIDMKALCRAVVDGTAPVTFVTANLRSIRDAIRAKISPLRECPGLVIRATSSAIRRGPR